MEESKSNGGFEIPWRLMIVLAGMAFGFLTIPPPLTTSRPQGDRPDLGHSTGKQRIPARLWQDPIQVMEAELASAKTNGGGLEPKSLEEVAGQLGDSRSYSSCTNGKVRVLMAIVSGGHYAADIETRLRSRYAILSALGAAGYSPKDADHLDYFAIPSTEPNRRSASAVRPSKLADHPTGGADSNYIAFEWFKPCPTRRTSEFCQMHSEVAVWWIRDEDLGNRPLHKLAQLEAAAREKFLGGSSGKPGAPTKEDLQFSLIGPRSSTQLQDILEEAEAAREAETVTNTSQLKTRLEGTSVFSPWATAADLFLCGQTNGLTREGVRDNLWTDVGIEFHNCTATDDQLVSTLIRELSLRGVRPSRTNNEIVLVAEWDTFYGRALPMTFMAKAIGDATGKRDFKGAIDTIQNGKPLPIRVRRFSYLRGVDGETGRPDSRADGSAVGPKGDKPSMGQRTERPDGQGQWDYIRRTASQLDEELSVDDGWANVQAVGVLGGDVYDKLLLLQALRERVKGKLFFTTDLDALYLDPSQHHWSRNLLVASSFGLQLPGWQRDIPAFRDTYQTAQYLACLEALGEHPRGAEELTGYVEPWIFEIGRTEAVSLGTGASTLIHPTTGRQIWNGKSGTRQARGTIQSSGFAATGDLKRFLKRAAPKLAAPFLILLILAPCVPSLNRFLRKQERQESRDLEPCEISKEIDDVRDSRSKSQKALFKYLLVSILLVEAFIIIVLSLPDTEEPLRWFEGVSIWPTEFARLIGLFLCVWFIIKIRFDAKEGKLMLSRDYFDPDSPPLEKEVSTCPKLRGTPLPKYVGGWMDLHREIGLEFVKHAPSHRPEAPLSHEAAEHHRMKISASELFKEYCVRAPWKHRVLRAVPVTFLQVCLAFALMCYFGFPFRPYRGPLSGAFDGLVFWVCFVMAIFLVAIVRDAAQLCREFVERLGDGRTIWPPEVLNRYSLELGVAKEDLDGWLDVRFVADYTARVGQTVYYPFLVVLILAVAQSRFVDDWICSLPLVVIIGTIVLYSIYSAVILRKTAEKVRKDALETLDPRISLSAGSPFKWETVVGKSASGYVQESREGEYDKKLKALRKEIVGEKRGAFAPFLMDPAIGAVIFSAVGTGLTLLIQNWQGGH